MPQHFRNGTYWSVTSSRRSDAAFLHRQVSCATNRQLAETLNPPQRVSGFDSDPTQCAFSVAISWASKPLGRMTDADKELPLRQRKVYCNCYLGRAAGRGFGGP